MCIRRGCPLYPIVALLWIFFVSAEVLNNDPMCVILPGLVRDTNIFDRVLRKVDELDCASLS